MGMLPGRRRHQLLGWMTSASPRTQVFSQIGSCLRAPSARIFPDSEPGSKAAARHFPFAFSHRFPSNRLARYSGSVAYRSAFSLPRKYRTGMPFRFTVHHVKRKGIPVRYFLGKEKAERYATDPEYRASLLLGKRWEKAKGK